MLSVPDVLRRNTRDVRGEAGLAWLETLAVVIVECEARWSLRVGPPFPDLSYNYVAPAIRADGTAAVLKLSFPQDKEFRSEAAALQLFKGRGVVRALEIDLALGALLLERLEPAEPLSTVADDRAIPIAAGVLRQMWRTVPADHPFPTVARWGQGFRRLRGMFDGGSGPLPATLFDDAERLYLELEATSEEPVLLHGDLHAGNVLSATREHWLAIDPKGIVGEPAFDTGALVRDRRELLAGGEGPRVLSRRIAHLAEELGLDRERIRRWALAQAVLSAVWTVEDHADGWQSTIACAELLATLRV